ncbi:hypothetical protein ACJ41O_008205 [Fusarium nematophilum]
MDRSKTRPLKTIHLKSRPLTTHALAWSCDAELAVATDDTIYIFLPEYPRGNGPDDAGEEEELQSQFSLSYRASGLIRPDPTINAQLCAFAGIRVVGPPANDENWFPGVGNGLVTGSGASICQIVRLEWSPNGLGCNLRPILTALSTNGGIYALGEHIDRQSTMIAGMQTRSFKAWKTLWGLGAQLPLPDAAVDDGYRNMNERIQAIALEGLDSDSDDSEDEFMEDEYSKLQVHESRYRIWGMAPSPGGGATAVLVSRYSTQHPERRALCKLMFARQDQERSEEAMQNGAITPTMALTTEGQVWEWMYGNGPEVPGTTAESKTSQDLQDSPLREQFRQVAVQQHCVFCDMALRMDENEAKCENGHLFEQHLGLGTEVESSGEVCGGCGGKFVA